MHIHLGHDLAAEATPLAMPARALLRHMMALGSSGSGKTVLCKIVVEEAVRRGIPVICIDPQGDLCSLALEPAARDRGAGTDHGGAREFFERADVVVFTPASRKGIPLCADPLGGTHADVPADDKLQAMSRAASMLVALLGYDIDSDDGAGLRAVIDTALADLDAAGTPAQRLEDVTAYFTALGDAELERYGRFLDPRKIRAACQRLARLDVGARRLLFHDGLPIDIDMLLGRGPRALPGRTRVSVIYLNTLHSQEDKDFFVAALVERLYAWMLEHPSAEPQALFYIDEIAPFMPPVRKPSCKPGLSLLFKQARKYGVCCLMATQNPGDVDYKAMAQFGTWALGRLTTRQDLKKVEPTVKSMAPERTDAIMEELPARRPGELTLLSPDVFEDARALATRRLFSAHETLDEDRIERLADERWRERFAGLMGAEPVRAEPVRAERVMRAPAVIVDDEPDDERVQDEPVRDTTPRDARAAELERLARTLAARKSMSARELAERASLGESRARSALKSMVDAGLARSYQDGRTTRYYAVRTGARPDLDLGAHVAVVRPALDEPRIRKLAREHLRTKLLGLLGEDEELHSVRLIYRPVYQVAFEEHVEHTGLRRLFGAERDRVVGTLYHHPVTFQILAFTSRRGIEFADQPAEHASDVEDFDGVATFDDLAPASIVIDEDAWKRRRPMAALEQHFRDRFGAEPRKVTPVFVPLWEAHLHRPERGNFRVIVLDALVGRPVSWPVEEQNGS